VGRNKRKKEQAFTVFKTCDVNAMITGVRGITDLIRQKRKRKGNENCDRDHEEKRQRRKKKERKGKAATSLSWCRSRVFRIKNTNPDTIPASKKGGGGRDQTP